ncbi:MAG: type II toxin-antitoxin system HipA family toxin YjjJ [Burkholderiaceae bacterium]
MRAHAESIRRRLAQGPATPKQLVDLIGFSQPSLSRALVHLGPALVRMGAARSIQYFLRDDARSLSDLSIHRVDQRGALDRLGYMVPVRPDGFITFPERGKASLNEGLPWWLHDMRPQGYLGRAYAQKHARTLGLPDSVSDWSDTHALLAMLRHGHDMVGNLLIGDHAVHRFIQYEGAEPVVAAAKPSQYAELARRAADGEPAGSSAGGEQPKFTAYAMTDAGARHVIVKFSEVESGPVAERWRDLLLAEHLALLSLRDAGISAAQSCIIDTADQRFLEVVRFDRVGRSGRRGMHSLAALDAAFVGLGNGSWPSITRILAAERRVDTASVEAAALLWTFGTLIGNTDMHLGNLSFMDDHGPPYQLAPAYDMTPMAFRPRNSGALPDRLAAPKISLDVPSVIWRRAFSVAENFYARVKAHGQFSARFAPCIEALDSHLSTANTMLARLA